jgi:hypothetical protein
MTFRQISQYRQFMIRTIRCVSSVAAFAVGAHCGTGTFGIDLMGTTSIKRLLDESGDARSAGNLGLAYGLLHEAVRIDPNNSQARWQLGQVKVGGEWLSIEESQRRAAADPRQAKYQANKNSSGDGPGDHLALARWCRNNNLDEEARVHWAGVLSSDPSHKEALRNLHVRWNDGQLVSPGQVKELRQEASSAQQNLRRWKASVAAWMRALSDKRESPPTEVIDAIHAVDDVAAIPAFELVTLSVKSKPATQNPAVERLSRAFMTTLARMPDEAATNSLVRHAVMSPFSDVRDEAIIELRNRPLTDFVPALLDALAARIKSEYRVQTDPAGNVHYLQNVYREGPFADWLHRRARSIYQPWSPVGVLTNISPSQPSSTTVEAVNTPTRAVSAAAAQRSAASYEREIVASELQIQATNEQSAARNERIVDVLTGVTNQNLGSEPRAWWDWWQDHTDYYRAEERPVYETQESSSEYVVPPPPSGGGVECFVRGTPVWTKTGQRAIETLAVGDLVLSRNVNSGELAYKPVMLRTLRPAGPVVEISTCNEQIRATRGHPLWVDGLGWRMAKELDDGALLHSVAGATRVEAVKPISDAETYNLVVADFNTYFVGKDGILVHDNTPRRPTRATVPGLGAK